MDSLTILLVIILSIGLTQGIVFAAILWNQADNRIANRIKAMLLLVISYGLLNQVLRLFDIGRYDTWYHLTLDLNWSYGPLLFLYIKAQTTENYGFPKKDRWVLIPVLIQIICSVYVRSQNFYWDGTRESLTWLGYWGYSLWMNYSSVPIIASSLIIYFSFRSLKLLNQLSPHQVIEENLSWVKTLIKGFGAYYVVVLIILVVDLIVFTSTVSLWYFYFTRFYYYPFFIGVAILSYWFGISSVIKSDQRVIKPTKSLSEAESRLLEELLEKAQKLMTEQKVYKQADLNLAALADQIESKPYLLTKALNEIQHKSFNDYINEFRVAEIKELVNDPKNDKYTLLSLAYEAGFNSKSSFNRAVKKHLGISPSELKSHS